MSSNQSHSIFQSSAEMANCYGKLLSSISAYNICHSNLNSFTNQLRNALSQSKLFPNDNRAVIGIMEITMNLIESEKRYRDAKENVRGLILRILAYASYCVILIRENSLNSGINYVNSTLSGLNNAVRSLDFPIPEMSSILLPMKAQLINTSESYTISLIDSLLYLR